MSNTDSPVKQVANTQVSCFNCGHWVYPGDAVVLSTDNLLAHIDCDAAAREDLATRMDAMQARAVTRAVAQGSIRSTAGGNTLTDYVQTDGSTYHGDNRQEITDILTTLSTLHRKAYGAHASNLVSITRTMRFLAAELAAQLGPKEVK